MPSTAAVGAPIRAAGAAIRAIGTAAAGAAVGTAVAGVGVGRWSAGWSPAPRSPRRHTRIITAIRTLITAIRTRITATRTTATERLIYWLRRPALESLRSRCRARHRDRAAAPPHGRLTAPAIRL